MSNVFYPDLPGLQIEVGKTPGFTTKAQRSVSGNEARAAMQAYPLWTFKVAYEVLRAGAEKELQTLGGFFGARKGSFDSFLFSDPTDNAVTDQPIGTGNGGQNQFQLMRTFGYGAGCTFDEPVNNVIALANVKINGVTKTLTTDYTVSATGLLTFVTPPANALPITWTGSFAYRCRFNDDEMDLKRFLQDLWKTGDVEFIGSPMNKVGS